MIINNGIIIINSDDKRILVKAEILDSIASKVIEMSKGRAGGYYRLGKFVVDILIENGIIEEDKQ